MNNTLTCSVDIQNLPLIATIEVIFVTKNMTGLHPSRSETQLNKVGDESAQSMAILRI